MSTSQIEQLSETIEEALEEMRQIDPNKREKQTLDEAYMHLRKAQEALLKLSELS
jgi:hypothetical protein